MDCNEAGSRPQPGTRLWRNGLATRLRFRDMKACRWRLRRHRLLANRPKPRPSSARRWPRSGNCRTGGIQSARGSRFVEAIWTVVETRRQQSRGVFASVTAAARAHHASQPTPARLPGVQALAFGPADRPAAVLAAAGARGLCSSRLFRASPGSSMHRTGWPRVVTSPGLPQTRTCSH